MTFSGSKTFDSSALDIWNLLMDPVVLARITPGISNLQAFEPNSFKAEMKVNIGPVKRTFIGNLKIVDKDEPKQFSMLVTQDSKIGNVDARVDVSLQEQNSDTTILLFEGKAKLSGLLARTGQRVLTGVANSMTKKFFSALEKEILNLNH